MQFVLLTALAILLIIIQVPAYADSALSGSGFGIISNTVKSVSIQTSLVQDSGKLKLQNGPITIDVDNFQLITAKLSLSDNKKILQLNASTDSFTLDVSGKLVTSAGSDSIYYVTGKTSNGPFSAFIKLQQISPKYDV